MKITLFSDSHSLHNKITSDLPGGDLICHGGDSTSMGREKEILDFCKWYDGLNYTHKVFIAGNHDWGFQNNVENINKILEDHKEISYLQDNEMIIKVNDEPEVKIYGTPWQPEFYNWAFNLPKNGPGLASKWEAIPEDTDILITHGPPFGKLDDVEGKRGIHLGCELLAERINEIKPKICIFGHIHTGYGHYFDGHTHFFNAAVLNENYRYAHLPFTFDWNPITNEITWL
jgi:predicted phosphohydrolase